jgi:hypothetical protein
VYGALLPPTRLASLGQPPAYGLASSGLGRFFVGGPAVPVTAVDRVEAALAELTREEIAALPPARRRRLQATLGAWECLCDDILQRAPPSRPPLARCRGSRPA